MDVQQAWDRLCTVRKLTFEARSGAITTTGWNGSGKRTVLVQLIDAEAMLFHESGAWTPEGVREITFSNVFRWGLDLAGQRLCLEHLRFGPANPVHLFDLGPVSERTLESVEPHVCREDLYTARLVSDQEAVRLNWSIIGPRKDERIAYVYK